jgi:hypothetical protein
MEFIDASESFPFRRGEIAADIINSESSEGRGSLRAVLS